MTVPALTVNKVCLSGLNAIAMADQLIGYGEFDIVVAGGMESMTNGPYLLPGARAGYRYGDTTLIDATAHDALFCAFDQLGMGAATDVYSRSARSAAPSRTSSRRCRHERAATAAQERAVRRRDRDRRGTAAQGRPTARHRRRGSPPGHHRREPGQAAPGVRRRRHRHRRLGQPNLRRRGGRGRHVPRAKAEELGATVLAEIGAHGVVAGPDPSLLSQPSNAIAKALGREGLTPADIDLFEINEAFAAVAIQSMRDLDIGPDMVNVNGGAIAMGHPVGASGARLALHLALELRRRGGGLGAAGALRRRRPGRGPAPARSGLTRPTLPKEHATWQT